MRDGEGAGITEQEAGLRVQSSEAASKQGAAVSDREAEGPEQRADGADDTRRADTAQDDHGAREDATRGTMGRREALGVMSVVPLVAALDWGGGSALTERVARAAQAALSESERSGAAYAPKFFTAHEWKTVRVLVDMVIPRDERSGSATDAGVPEFMDFMMMDRPSNQLPMRGGLAWLDAECRRRSGKSFIACSPAERAAVLDDIAWPDKAAPEASQGVAFFNRFRDLTASGFFSSKMGVADLRYKGNTAVPVWKGCPEPALAKLGVKYDAKWDADDHKPSRG